MPRTARVSPRIDKPILCCNDLVPSRADGIFRDLFWRGILRE